MVSLDPDPRTAEGRACAGLVPAWQVNHPECRYIVSHRRGLNPHDVSQWLSEAYPQAKIKPGEQLDTPERMDGSRLKDLGIVLRQPRETLLDMAAVLLALGLVKL